jgi:hypothetical protein
MADIVLDNRLATLEGCARDLKERVSVLDDDNDGYSTRLLKVETWKDGNGAKGAEKRLQEVEDDVVKLKECFGASSADDAIERIASAAARSIVKGAREKDMTTVAKMRAAGPLLTGLAAVVASVVTLVAVFAR